MLTDAYYQNREYAPFARKVWQVVREKEAQPQAQLWNVDEVKGWLGVPLSDTSDDQIIDALILSATQQAEKYTGRAFITRAVTAYYDYMPWIESTGNMGVTTKRSDITMQGGNVIELRRLPLGSVSSVLWYFKDGSVSDPWSADNYLVDNKSDNVKGRLVIKDSVSIPTNLREANGLEIIYNAGYGTSVEDVPYMARQAVLNMVTYSYGNRGDCGEQSDNPLRSSGAESMLRQYRDKGIV